MKVSVAIVTRNRANEIKHCLGALVSQTVSLDELIVVDNNSSDETKVIVEKFKSRVNFPVKYILEKRVGYPIVYNRGINEASNKWIAFIDDDCIANINWFKNVKLAVSKNKDKAAILGRSGTYFINNVYSLITLFFDEFWKLGGMNRNKVADLEILDNKNIVYNKLFLEKNKLVFNEENIKYFNGACEDSDLGMQIQQAGGKAVYEPAIYVEHKDPNNFSWYYKKLWGSSLSHFFYESNWDNFRNKNKSISSLKKQKASDYIEVFFEEKKLSSIQKINFMFNFVLTVLINKTLRIISFLF